MKSVGFDEMSSWEKLWDVGTHLLIPVTVLAASTLATLFRLMRSQMIEVLEMDFLLYLRSTGISERKVFFKHALRNAINPMVTLFGLELPGLFSGAALVEIFTGWPGLGQIMLQAVRMQDMFLVMGNMVTISFLLIVGNLISDLSLAALDPRIRMK
jgi:peptide/nickel transport system permease protein